MSTPLRAGTLLALACAFAVAHAEVPSDPEARKAEFHKLPWQKGPADGPVGGHAHLTVPKDSALLPETSGARFLELTGNLPDPGHTILASDHWWATFAYHDTGYIKDDEKLDADKLLEELKRQDGEANEARRKAGLHELYTDGWIVPPHYDADSKQLEWGLKLHASDSPEPIVNYTMRVLGRHGYESVVLVTSPETLQADVKELRSTLKGFDFNAGEKYAEFRQGDRVAEFGLGALVVGGATAAAIKGGWFKGLLAALAAAWKLVAAAAVALAASVRKLFSRSKT